MCRDFQCSPSSGSLLLTHRRITLLGPLVVRWARVISSGRGPLSSGDATSRWKYLAAAVRPFSTLFSCPSDQEATCSSQRSYEVVEPLSSWVPEGLYGAAPPVFASPICLGPVNGREINFHCIKPLGFWGCSGRLL